MGGLPVFRRKCDQTRNLERVPAYFRFNVNGTRSSAPIPKFASYRGEFDCELRNQRSTSNFMILVRFLNLKFLIEFAAI